MPATQKQQSRYAGHGDHVGVLGHEEHGKLHSAIFRVISGNQFGLCFRQIERNAVGLRIGRDQVHEEREKLTASKDVPVQYAALLVVHDFAKAERTGKH
jgi:hypothetical protein